MVHILLKTYKTVTVLVVLYGYETWSFRLGEEDVCGLRIFEGKVLRRILGGKKERILHCEELHGLCCVPKRIRVIKSGMSWAGHVERMGGNVGGNMNFAMKS
jgi:hypothetical protein